jgi:hypothetical protein
VVNDAARRLAGSAGRENCWRAAAPANFGDTRDFSCLRPANRQGFGRTMFFGDVPPEVNEIYRHDAAKADLAFR